MKSQGCIGDLYEGTLTLKGTTIRHRVNIIHSQDVSTILQEAEILAKIIGVHNDHEDEAEHHENVRKLFGLVFNDTLTEVEFIP